MKIQTNTFRKNITLIPIVTIIYYLIAFSIDKSYWLYIIGSKQSAKELAIFIVAGLILSFIFIEISICSGRLIFKSLQWVNDTYTKMIISSVALFLVNNVTAYLVSIFVIYLDYEESAFFFQNLYTFGMLVTFVSGIYLTSIYLDEYKRIEKIKDELEIKLLKEKQIKTDAKLNMIKQQIDPHFMFNSFSILSELIAESPKVAEKFLEHLSSIYRYILQNINKDLTSLEEELNLLHSYMYLMDIRYQDSIILNIPLNLKEVTGYIPTASFQMLAENAIKHNRLSPTLPLRISVYLEGEYIVMENGLIPLTTKMRTTHLGLKSIVDRYTILGDALPIVQKTQEKFIVKLPIIQK